MSQRIQKALGKLFQKHRIIFWYDEENQLRDSFDAVAVDGVKKVEIGNNEFSLKHRLIRQEPEQKFLVYKPGPEPELKDNWLLDVQLANTQFRTDKASLWLAELDLPYHFKPIVANHEAFFKRAERRDRLRESVTSTDTASQIRLKMLGVCTQSDLRLDSVLEALLAEYAAGKTTKFDLIESCKLSETLWQRTEEAYGYQSSSKSVKDFVIKLFRSCYSTDVSGKGDLKTEALVFLKRWKDSRSQSNAFETISNELAELFESDLEGQNIKTLGETDYFQLIDKKVLSELANAVLDRSMTAGEVAQVVRGRRRGHWYRDFKHLYEAIDHAAQLTALLDSLQIDLESVQRGLELYTETYYRIDQLYRKYIFHMRKAGDNKFFQKLNESLCGRYSNHYLMPLGDRWQELLDEADGWPISKIESQSSFYGRFVKKMLEKNRKVYVVISDAMRFEIGEELSRRVRQEDRFESELGHVVTGLPSYTQLGMASMLPHKTLEITDDGTVMVDGQSSAGTANRNKILKQAAGEALAIKADDFLRNKTEDVRALVRDHEVIYIYHDRIDDVGHSRDTEREAFVAAETALEEVLRIVKMLTSGNATNILVTADHGFLYQDDVEESDYSQAEVSGSTISTDRRFVVGRELKTKGAVRCYSGCELGLEGDAVVAIPKSINRFRKKGSGTRFLHGGSSLQEIVVPVVQIKKRKKADVSEVEVDVMPPTTSVISTGQLSVAFYQTGPISDKVHARVLRVGLYASDGELISDQHELIFDLTSENAREREQKLRLVLSKSADNYNQQPITLRLDELIKGTEEYKAYKSQQYTLRRSFTSDFD